MLHNKAVIRLADDIYTFINAEAALLDIFMSDFSKGKLPDISLAHTLEIERYAQDVKRRIKDIRNEKIEHHDALALDTIEYLAGFNFHRGFKPCPSRFYYLDFPITAYSSPLTYLNNLASLPLLTEDDLVLYLKVMEEYPRLLRQIRDKVYAQAEHGIYLPKDQTTLSLAVLRTAALPADEHPLTLKDKRVSAIPGDHRKKLEEIRRYVEEGVHFVNDTIDFICSETYRSRQPQGVGLSQYPGGKEYYEYLLHYHLTCDITAQELNSAGHMHMEKIITRMEALQRGMGYDISREGFREVYHGMPALYRDTAEGIGECMRLHLDRIRPVMPAWFNPLCEDDCDVKRMQPENEKTMSFGQYTAPTTASPKGYYIYNGTAPETKNQIVAAALVYHELLPGHHLQFNLAAHNKALHPLFRNLMINVYTEGWAEYAAALAGEMGMYTDPLDEYGRLTMDLFLTTRLIVDTGMGVLGMTRKQAQSLLSANTEWNEHMCFAECNRYANDIPAQALSYKFGSIKIFELREKAMSALGARFDIREFHRHVLELGAVPLHVLQKHIDWYVSKKLGKQQMS